MEKRKGITNKQRRFADEYLLDCNAAQAALRAGYSDKSGAYASKLLNTPEIKEYINSELEKIHCKSIADAEEVMEFLTQIMRGEVREQIVMRTGGEQQLEMIEVSAKERLKAAELIGKRYGIFSESANAQAEPVIICGGDELED